MKNVNEFMTNTKKEEDERKQMKKDLDEAMIEIADLKAQLAAKENEGGEKDEDAEGGGRIADNGATGRPSYAELVSSVNKELMEKVDDKIKDSFKDVKKKVEKLVENDDKERRAKNFVLMGVPEVEEKDTTKRRAGEHKFVKDMLAHMGHDDDDVKIEEFTRLGKYELNKHPRVLRVTVASEKEKWKVVGKGQTLRNSTDFSRVFVQPDLNQEDRKKEKELVAELKDKRKNDTSKNWAIKRGKVVGRTKPPGEQTTQ